MRYFRFNPWLLVVLALIASLGLVSCTKNRRPSMWWNTPAVETRVRDEGAGFTARIKAITYTAKFENGPPQSLNRQLTIECEVKRATDGPPPLFHPQVEVIELLNDRGEDLAPWLEFTSEYQRKSLRPPAMDALWSEQNTIKKYDPAAQSPYLKPIRLVGVPAEAVRGISALKVELHMLAPKESKSLELPLLGEREGAEVISGVEARVLTPIPEQGVISKPITILLCGSASTDFEVSNLFLWRATIIDPSGKQEPRGCDLSRAKLSEGVRYTLNPQRLDNGDPSVAVDCNLKLDFVSEYEVRPIILEMKNIPL